jgi:aryl-alcohol dehydrogenase-like predicted oxidoreductase
MQTRKIGTLDVTVVGIGTNNFGMRIDEDAAGKVVDAALDAGINFFDTADIYGRGKSEEFLGRALQGRRDQAIIGTKFGMAMGDDKGASPEYVKRAVEASLKRLGTDRIDLYQLHYPDAETPIADTLEAMDALVREGKVLEIGCSNFSGELLAEAADAAKERGVTPFVSVQNHFNVLNRDAALGTAEAQGIAFLPFFPLASGMLTGKYQRGEAPPEGTRMAGMPDERRAQAMSDKTFDVVESLAEFARDHGHTITDLAFQWLLAHDAIPSVIAGATKPEQVAANAAAGTVDWTLSAEDLAEIDRRCGV